MVVVMGQQSSESVVVHQSALNFLKHGKNSITTSVLVDIAERKKNQENLRLSENVFQAAADAIMVTDASGAIKSINPAFTNITGYSLEDVVGQTPRLLKSGRYNRKFYTNFWRDLYEKGRWSGEIWHRRKNGEVYPAWETISAVRSSDGNIIEYIAFFNDITARKQAEHAISYRANYDQLTGLPNRSLFQDRLEQALMQARRYGRQVALMFADLDCFKQVNDTLGHSFGDKLLYQTAMRLSSCVRDTDTVARLGGDEFVIILKDLAREQNVDIVAEKIINCLIEPFFLEDHNIHISASIGISLYPSHGTNAEALVRRADLAMYQAKIAGRSKYQLYELSMDDGLAQQLLLERELRLALERRELVLHFQPILDVNYSLKGAEALLRWVHPDRGTVLPREFIHLAEKVGLIREICIWIFDQACQTLQKWHELGLNIPISINITSLQVFRGLSLEMVTSCLKYYGLTPQSIVFEIKESVLLADNLHVRRWLKDIRELGICINLDNFGTGCSSLSCLKSFLIDQVKIDLSVVCDILVDPVNRAFVEAILVLTRSLRLEVIAEGIENKEQLELLKDIGCRYVQGYYFSPPVSSAKFVDVARNLGAVKAKD
jgi:diguanylate cyclase (GGDEF)-like protein/PAS domain S-box-containing protein